MMVKLKLYWKSGIRSMMDCIDWSVIRLLSIVTVIIFLTSTCTTLILSLTPWYISCLFIILVPAILVISEGWCQETGKDARISFRIARWIDGE